MPVRLFRFGVVLAKSESRAAWRDKARLAEDLGYDVLLVPDHLNMPAPFPALVATAEATSRPRVGTLVLNTGLYSPALLARDVATTAQLVDNRLEVGLGAGYVRDDYELAELPFLSPGRRVEQLERTVTRLRQVLSRNQRQSSRPGESPVPIMIAGRGDRLLRLAASQADIVGLAGVTLSKTSRAADEPGMAALADRTSVITAAAGDRLPAIELSLMVPALLLDGDNTALPLLRQLSPELSDAEILQQPGVLEGSTHSIAETLHRYRCTYGITYFTVTEQGMIPFAKVIQLLR